MKNSSVRNQLPLPEQNHLFALMPNKIKTQLRQFAEPVSLKRDQVLIAPGRPQEHVYFPIDAIAALIFMAGDGATTEVAVVGNDGVVGALSLLSGEDTYTMAYVMSEGFAYRLPKQFVQEELHADDSALSIFLRYIQLLITQTSITAACYRYHTIEQQFCKLLLFSLDRLPCNNLTLTHELASTMLGVRREGVTEAAIKLQRLGVIEYHRGHVTVLDRTKLEQLCCECYKVFTQQIKKLLPTPGTCIPVSTVYATSPNRFVDPKCIYCFKFGSCIYLKRNIIQATKKCIE